MGKRLTESERTGIIESKIKGGTNEAVARRFNVANVTVSKVFKEYKASLPSNTPAPPPVVPSLVSVNEFAVAFEGDTLVLRIPKIMITKELLKGLI
mgnify:CR=1 FL=1